MTRLFGCIATIVTILIGQSVYALSCPPPPPMERALYDARKNSIFPGDLPTQLKVDQAGLFFVVGKFSTVEDRPFQHDVEWPAAEKRWVDSGSKSEITAEVQYTYRSGVKFTGYKLIEGVAVPFETEKIYFTVVKEFFNYLSGHVQIDQFVVGRIWPKDKDINSANRGLHKLDSRQCMGYTSLSEVEYKALLLSLDAAGNN